MDDQLEWMRRFDVELKRIDPLGYPLVTLSSLMWRALGRHGTGAEQAARRYVAGFFNGTG